MRQERVAANGRPGGAQRNKTGRGTARRAPTQSNDDSATGPTSVAEIYFSGRMALWAALMSGSGNTPRIRTATDATVSTATEAGDITTRTP